MKKIDPKSYQKFQQIITMTTKNEKIDLVHVCHISEANCFVKN